MISTPRLIALSVIVFFVLPLFSQEKLKLGKVPSEDLKMTVYEPEPGAEAAYLAKTAFVEMVELGDKLKMKYDYFNRIKILSEAGYDNSDVELSYYHYRGSEKISSLKAIITYPNGESYKLTNKEFFREEIDDKWTRIKFTFPNLQVGAVLDYEYSLISSSIISLEDFEFQHDIPVRFAEFSFDFPDHIDYVFIKQGDQYIKQGDQLYTMENVPSMKEEAYITTMKDYRGVIKTQVQGYRDSYRVFHPLYTTWEKVMEEIYDNDMFGHQINRKAAYNKILKAAEPILSEDIAIKEKILKLQNFILDNVSWNEEYRIFSTRGLDNAFEAKTANATELNLMMLAILKELEIESYPLLVSTRSNGKLITTYPLIDQFSYALIFAKIDGEEILLDISDRYRMPGDIKYSGLNLEGLIANEKQPIWYSIKPHMGKDIFMGNFEIKDGGLHGVLKGKYDSYNAIPERWHYNDDKSGKHWEDRLRKKFSETEVISADFEALDNLYESFKDEVNISIPGACVDAGDLMYIDPFIYSNYDENIFKQEDRQFPVDFGFPQSEQFIFMLKIPEGYDIDEIPESVSMSTEDHSANFIFKASKNGNVIQIIRKMEIKKAVFMPSEYLALKRLFDLMLEKNGEQLVLKKV